MGKYFDPSVKCTPPEELARLHESSAGGAETAARATKKMKRCHRCQGECLAYYCPGCFVQVRAEQYAHNKAQICALKEERRTAGLCVQCGKVPPKKGVLRCQRCLDLHRVKK